MTLGAQLLIILVVCLYLIISILRSQSSRDGHAMAAPYPVSVTVFLVSG